MSKDVLVYVPMLQSQAIDQGYTGLDINAVMEINQTLHESVESLAISLTKEAEEAESV